MVEANPYKIGVPSSSLGRVTNLGQYTVMETARAVNAVPDGSLGSIPRWPTTYFKENLMEDEARRSGTRLLSDVLREESVSSTASSPKYGQLPKWL